MSHRSYFLIILLGLLIPTTGCEGGGGAATDEVVPANKEIDFGTYENSVYRNKYFNLSITLPEDWHVQDQEAQKQLMALGSQVLAGEDQDLKAAVKASELTSVTMLTAFQHPLGTPVPYNPNIVCVAEKVKNQPGITSGADYLYHTRKVLEAGQIQIEFPDATATATLGGKEFARMPVKLTIAGITAEQDYHSIILDGYALSIIVSYNNEEQKDMLQGILDSVTF